MKYAIVFSSQTGNTARLAEVIKECVTPNECVYFGEPDEKALIAPMIFVGFWTDKGTCNEASKNFFKTLKSQKVFLFGTAGFGGDHEYFQKILNEATANINATVQVEDSFMCQGKMSETVLKRYEKLLADGADVKGMIDNFHGAATHPDQADLENLKKKINKLIERYSAAKGS